MQTLTGKAIVSGLAHGAAHISASFSAPSDTPCRSTEAEFARFRAAVAAADAELAALEESARRETDENIAAIFGVHRLLLTDRDYTDAVADSIQSNAVCAEDAVRHTAERFAALFEAADDTYLRTRATDVREVSARLLRCLADSAPETTPDIPCILFSDELLAGDILRFGRERLRALVCRRGSPDSHAAILARSLGIPCLVCPALTLSALTEGTPVLILNDTLIFAPTPEALADYEAKAEEKALRQQELSALADAPAVTQSGRRVALHANIGGAGDIPAALKAGAEGIGLFRSEFLFLGRDSLPDEEEQFAVYHEVLEAMGDRRVTVRTLDLGADKPCPALSQPPEENPALGVRGIRLCLQNPALFQTQLRALLRAAVYGELRILYPMIDSADELAQIRTCIREAADALERAGIAYRIPPQGIMIETPAAALLADELAPLADFFSVGTNDLTQYTLALDRGNEHLTSYYDPAHKAVLRLIAHTAACAHDAGIPIAVCGELAADPTLTERFLAFGIDELSVAPPHLLPLRAHIRKLP